MKTAKLMTWMVAAAMTSAVVAPLALAAIAPTATPTATLTPESVNDAVLIAAVASQAKGAAVLRAQILLERARPMAPITTR